ncbi:MAG TPA: GNAT family N-acetyltransferase [Dokdonella sp.]|uniref:GNAT family N-acetyltransferase n=1 Tax=Dokdonella sp. TaxID=2291710 RepID=UPI002CE5ADC7|nr:GNAT family N-acetyltransferase [Dokdonella sp.]HUD43898.1 GNAT family N-acetyltransferase [Dokdonella sp.]
MPLVSLRVRRAVNGDLPALIDLENASFASDRISPRQWRWHLESDSARVLVALHERRLLGACVVFFRKGSDLARLYSMAVAEHARGRRVGEQLLEAAEQAALRSGCRRLRLEVRAGNLAAQRLYERNGYRRLAALPGYYEDGEDGWRYEKALSRTPTA